MTKHGSSAAVRHALASANLAHDSAGADGTCVVYLTAAQVQHMEGLMDTLGISRTLLLNMAARYGLSRLGRDGAKPKAWPKKLGKEALQVDLTGETLQRLPASVQVGPLIVFGLKALHSKLGARR